LRAGLEGDQPGALYSVTSAPAIYKDLVITGAMVPEFPSKGPSGRVRAFDVRTGKLVWTFHTIPRPGETGLETWEGDAWKRSYRCKRLVHDERGQRAWPDFSSDWIFVLRLLWRGPQRRDLFSNSLVALNAATGKLVWYFQMVHHDIWDYDMPAQPV